MCEPVSNVNLKKNNFCACAGETQWFQSINKSNRRVWGYFQHVGGWERLGGSCWKRRGVPSWCLLGKPSCWWSPPRPSPTHHLELRPFPTQGRSSHLPPARWGRRTSGRTGECTSPSWGTRTWKAKKKLNKYIYIYIYVYIYNVLLYVNVKKERDNNLFP